MLSPIQWIKPRLRPLCVAFGATDMTLVLLSALSWYFVFDSAFEAQHIKSLYESQQNDDEGDLENVDPYDENSTIIFKFKEERSVEQLRLERTIRACGFIVQDNHLDDNLADSNYAGPAALIGAAMGGYFILGALLTSLNALDHPAARKVICSVALFGEGASSFFLFIGVAVLSTNNGLCRTEYYYEDFQPIFYLFVFTLIFICTYKTYEVTIVAFYLAEQAKVTMKEDNELNQARRSIAETKRSSLSEEGKHALLLPPAPPKKEAPKVDQSKDRGQGDAGLRRDRDRENKPKPDHPNAKRKRYSQDTAKSGSIDDKPQQRSHRRHFKNVPETNEEAAVSENRRRHNEGSEQRHRKRKENQDSSGNQDADGSERRRKRHSKDGSKNSGGSKRSHNSGGTGHDGERRHHHHQHHTKPKQHGERPPKAVREPPANNDDPEKQREEQIAQAIIELAESEMKPASE